MCRRPGTARWPGSAATRSTSSGSARTWSPGLGVDAAAETLVKALVRVGKDLGIPVVADGIERAGQRDLLAAMGCTLGLGPFVAAPVPPASIPGLAGAQGQGGGMAAGPGLGGEIAGARGRAGEMAGGPGLGGERLAGEHRAGG